MIGPDETGGDRFAKKAGGDRFAHRPTGDPPAGVSSFFPNSNDMRPGGRRASENRVHSMIVSRSTLSEHHSFRSVRRLRTTNPLFFFVLEQTLVVEP